MNRTPTIPSKRSAPGLAATLLCLAALGAPASAETVIGLVAPLSGPNAPLGEQMRQGAEAALAPAGAIAPRLEVADDACTAEGGAAAARKLVEANVAAVGGFLCTEAIEAALPILSKAGIPTIAVGVRANSLTDTRKKTGWQVYRLAPRADAEAEAIATILPQLWAPEFFAIIDDGTIYGRELAEGFRLAAEQKQLKPVYVDTFRPQLDNQIGLAGRLRKAGASHVFAGGDRNDLAILGRDAKEMDYALTIAGGETLRAASDGVEPADGTLMIGLPEWSDIANPDVVAAFRARKIEPDGYTLPTYAATEILIAAAVEAAETERNVADVLAETPFDTAIGPIKFDAKGDLAKNPYALFRFSAGAFVKAD